MIKEIEIKITTPFDESVIPLIDDLSKDLGDRFRSDGKTSSQEWEEKNLKFIFAKAYKNQETVGCGAIHPITDKIAELKRMYSNTKEWELVFYHSWKIKRLKLGILKFGWKRGN